MLGDLCGLTLGIIKPSFPEFLNLAGTTQFVMQLLKLSTIREAAFITRDAERLTP